MTKVEELEALDKLLNSLSDESYLKPWLKLRRGDVQHAIVNDFPIETEESVHLDNIHRLREEQVVLDRMIAEKKARLHDLTHLAELAESRLVEAKEDLRGFRNRLMDFMANM